MLRQFLTFFALLTGLAATAAPVEARMAGAETRMEAAFEIVVTADRRQQQAALAQVPPVVHAALANDLIGRNTIPALPSVRIGIDRARE
ncbi:hypothetical protein MB02_04865 [Croceicoccus estronivorus]|nr:hypothetical protein MB02_04865 [Croceicoccus estronivorus]